MCFKKAVVTPIQNVTQKSVEEIVADKSKGMTPTQKAQYWYELSQSIFSLLGKVEVITVPVTSEAWLASVRSQYPTIVDIKLADSVFYAVSQKELEDILASDWSNLVKYVSELSDCDKYATRLSSHLYDYYGVTSVVPVWGESSAGYHAYNLAVLSAPGGLIARLIEPQSDTVFVTEGTLGTYTPRSLAQELGVKKLGT